MNVRIVIFLCLGAVPSMSYAMTYDNQFFPFGKTLFSRKKPREQTMFPELVMLFSSHSSGVSNNEMSLYSVFGSYDLNAVGQALEAIGKPNPIRSAWRGSSIPFRQGGKLEGMGCMLAYNRPLTLHMYSGAAIGFLSVKSWLDMRLGEVNFIAGPGDIDELYRTQRIANSELGIVSEVSQSTGFTDMDVYFAYGDMVEYMLRCKRIDVDARIGFLIPTGVKRHIDNAASVPFGGNGHAGLYGQLDAEFELKEDMKVGFWARVSKRFGRTELTRIPSNRLNPEPVNFGAIQGNFRVNPGLTLVLAPYIWFEDLRDGFGAGVRYIGIKKYGDRYCPECVQGRAPMNMKRMRDLSEWTAEYVSVTLFYDFDKGLESKDTASHVSGVWDIPVDFFGAQKISKTQRICLGVTLFF